MAAYAYKLVRDLLPPHLTTDADGFEGDPNYNGDLWEATSDYILELEKELVSQFVRSGETSNKRLLNWLRTREKTCYNYGPAIPTTSTTAQAKHDEVK